MPKGFCVLYSVKTKRASATQLNYFLVNFHANFYFSSFSVLPFKNIWNYVHVTSPNFKLSSSLSFSRGNAKKWRAGLNVSTTHWNIYENLILGNFSTLCSLLIGVFNSTSYTIFFRFFLDPFWSFIYFFFLRTFIHLLTHYFTILSHTQNSLTSFFLSFIFYNSLLVTWDWKMQRFQKEIYEIQEKLLNLIFLKDTMEKISVQKSKVLDKCE